MFQDPWTFGMAQDTDEFALVFAPWLAHF